MSNTETVEIMSREEVDDLKSSWAQDPCFDLWIEDEPDIAPYKDELIAFEKEMQATWKKEREELLTHKWEPVTASQGGFYTHRMKVFGGWVMTVELETSEDYKLSTVFIPDPKHEWQVFVPEVKS